MLPAAAQPRLVRALERDLALPDPTAAIEAALRLAAAFDGEMRSPSVAAAIREVLRADPRAVAVIHERRAQPAPIDAVRRFTRSQGRASVLRAPRFEEQAPSGAIPLRSFLRRSKHER